MTSTNTLPCELIQDLLPLYEDGLCSERSRDLIEEHLSECETCRNIYKTIHEEIRVTAPISENSAEAESFTQTAQADILKKLSRKLRQDKLFAGGCMLIIGLVLAILFSWLSETMFFDSQFGTVPIVDYRINAEDITVTELYELKNGDIYCTLDSRKPLSIITSSAEILVPQKYEDRTYEEGWQTVSGKVRFRDKLDGGSLTYTQFSAIFHRTESLTSLENGDAITHESSALYYEGKDDERKLIWKKGQDIKQAPASIEKKAELEKQRNEVSANTDELITVIFPEDTRFITND